MINTISLKESRMLSYILYLTSFFFSVFFWQYAAKRNDWVFKPTFFIDLVTEQLTRIYTFLGRIAVWISSFYTFFDFKDLIETFEELWISVKNLLFSWKSFIQSYVSNMNFYDHPYLITLGSITLIGLALYLVYRFRHWTFFQMIGNFVLSLIKYFNSFLDTPRKRSVSRSNDYSASPEFNEKPKRRSTRQTD